MSNKLHYARSDLAREIANELLESNGAIPSTKLVVNPGSGTFLSAQRRTGKSTFMRKDLIPELESRKMPVIYVDLWANRELDPALLIQEAIRVELRKQESLIANLARKAGLQKLSIGGVFTFDISQIGREVTIAATLTEFVEKHPAKRLVIIIDEAQHALTSDEGQASMYALKAARDALNIGQNVPRLLLVCTGSSRSKLGTLVTGKNSPFYGSRLRDFPPLDKGFTHSLNDRLKSLQPSLNGLSEDTVFAAFKILGYRPEELINTLGELAFQRGEEEDVNPLLLSMALERHEEFLKELDQQFHSLNPLQQIILRRIVAMGDVFSAYDSETMKYYEHQLGQEITVASIQNALDSLVEKDIVWRPKRGGYFIDDPLWNDWVELRAK